MWRSHFLFCTWKLYTLLLPLTCLALPPSGHPLCVIRNRTRSDPDPYALFPRDHKREHSGLKQLPFPSVFITLSHTCLLDHSNRENPWVIPCLLMAISGKTSNTDISTPAPVFTMRSRGPEPSHAMVFLENQVFSFLGYPLTAFCLAVTFPLRGISLLTDAMWTAFMVMPFFLIQWPPIYELQAVAFCGPLQNGGGLYKHLLSCVQNRAKIRLTEKKIGVCCISSSSGHWIIWHWFLKAQK